MNFKQYLAESTKTYNYRIKSVELLDKNAAAAIEKYLAQFDLKSISAVYKTPLQKTPLDFESVPNREVFIINVTLGLPISSFIIQRELVGILAMPGDYLIVRGENDQTEIQNDRAAQNADLAAQAEKKGLTAAPHLSTDSEYPEAEQTADGQNYYGDSYNSRLFGYLKKIAAERVEAQKVDAPAPLFSWLDMPKSDVKPDDQAFNKGIKKTVAPADKNAKTTAQTGNFDDEGVVIKKTYTDKSGKPKTLAAKPDSIRTKKKD